MLFRFCTTCKIQASKKYIKNNISCEFFFLVICLYEMTFHAHEMNRVRKMDLYFSIGIEKGRLLNVYAYNWEIHITSIINITPIYECTFFLPTMYMYFWQFSSQHQQWCSSHAFTIETAIKHKTERILALLLLRS